MSSIQRGELNLADGRSPPSSTSATCPRLGRRMSGTPSGPSLKRKFVSPYVGGSKGSPAGGPSSSAGSAKRAPPPPSDQPEAGPSRQSANTLSSASRGYNTAPAVKRNVFYGIGHQGEADGPAEEGEESYW